MPVRRVVTRSGRRFRGFFPSVKNGCMVPWESLLERDAITLFEWLRVIRRFEAQPRVVLWYDERADVRLYVPDFRVELVDGRVFDVEIKPAEVLARPDIYLRMTLIALRYAQLDEQFRLLTEQEIRKEPRLTRARLARRLSGRASSLLTGSDFVGAVDRHNPEGADDDSLCL